MSRTTTPIALLPHEQHLCAHDVVELWLNVPLVSETNVREHWSTRAKRAARQRELVALTFFQALGARWHLEADPAKPKRVHLTMYRGKPLDQDNLVSSAKHVVDGLVDARLISGDAPKDGHVFTYEQVPGIPTAKQGIRISVRLLEPPREAHDAAD